MLPTLPSRHQTITCPALGKGEGVVPRSGRGAAPLEQGLLDAAALVPGACGLLRRVLSSLQQHKDPLPSTLSLRGMTASTQRLARLQQPLREQSPLTRGQAGAMELRRSPSFASPRGCSSLLAADSSCCGFGPKVSYAGLLLLKCHSPARLRSRGACRAFAEAWVRLAPTQTSTLRWHRPVEEQKPWAKCPEHLNKQQTPAQVCGVASPSVCRSR